MRSVADRPLVLAIDTTAAHCAVAITSGSQTLFSRTEPMTKGQAERLLPLIEEALSACELGPRDLDRIAVATGPGNFTGVRIGVSAARGIALGLNIPAAGVGVLEATVRGLDGKIIAVLPAPQQNVYVQKFEGNVATGEPAVMRKSELETLSGDGVLFVGPAAAEFPASKIAHKEYPPPEVFGLIASEARPSERPKPIYIRAPDAKPSRERAPTLSE